MTIYISDPVEIEAMQWPVAGLTRTLESHAYRIVEWVNANGGEAEYEPEHDEHGHNGGSYDPDMVTRFPARIAVRSADGWRHAAPGDYIVMGKPMASLRHDAYHEFYPVADLSDAPVKHQWRVKSELELPADWWLRKGHYDDGATFLYCSAEGPERAHCVLPANHSSQHAWAWFTAEQRARAEAADRG